MATITERKKDGKVQGYIIGGEEPITLSIHRRMMERIGRTINLHGASPHIFRHSYATLLNDAGASVKTIQAIIGHSDVQTTANCYDHSGEDKKQKMVRSVSEILVVWGRQDKKCPSIRDAWSFCIFGKGAGVANPRSASFFQKDGDFFMLCEVFLKL